MCWRVRPVSRPTWRESGFCWWMTLMTTGSTLSECAGGAHEDGGGGTGGLPDPGPEHAERDGLLRGGILK